MARERTENLAESTLNGGINAAVLTLTVTSAASFPSVPQFRITVGDNAEIMLVTGVSGNVFTVVRAVEGPTAVTHADAAPVKLTQTRDGQRRYHRDWNNPLFDVGTPMQLLDSTGVTLNAASFTNVNFTGADLKADQTGGAILLEHATQGGSNSYQIIKRTAPGSAPRTLRCGFIPNLLDANGTFPSTGPVVRDSGTGELYAMRLLVSGNGTWVDVIKLASPTASSTAFLPRNNWHGGPVVWCEIEDDNTDIIFKVSGDGVNYIEVGREPRLTFLTPDEWGFANNNFGNTGLKCQGTLVAWQE